MAKNDNAPRDCRDQPTYWFAVLDIARDRGDFGGAAEAQRQLQRLGVTVSFRARQATPRQRRKNPSKPKP